MYRTKSCFGSQGFATAALASLLSLPFGALGCGSDDDNSSPVSAAMPATGAGGAATTSAANTPAPAPAASAMPAPAAAALPPGTLKVCDRPESAFFDGTARVWYVSCQAKNDVANDGYIAKLNADATAVITEKFVTELDEPKGIRVNAGKLYVSDVSELVTADVATGAKLATTTVVGLDPRVPENNSLNDVTVDEVSGDVYVSDNRNDILYRFDAEGKSPRLLLRSPVLEGPNGLLIDRRDPAAAPRLLIAALGPGLNPMLGTTAKLGGVLAIDLTDLNDGDDQVDVTHLSQRIGNLDGLEFYHDDLIVSDFFAGRVMRVTPTDGSPSFEQGDGKVIRQSFANSADLGIDVERNMIAVPETSKGTVVVITLVP